MIVRFIIDELSIDLNGLTSTAGVEVIQRLLDLIEDVRLDGYGVCFDDELFTVPIVEDRSFWDLFDVKSPVFLPPDVRERAAAVFGAMPRWYELDAFEPTDLAVAIDGGAFEITASVAWAHEQSKIGGLRSPACICAIGRRRTGKIAVEVCCRSEDVWFIANTADVERYFRWLITKYATTSDEIYELAGSAFKRLQFVDGCFDGIRKMSKACRQLVPKIVRHLSAFSDEGQRIFSGPWARVPAEFGSLGIDISDENGKTKNNSRAYTERRMLVDGDELVFWWHSKLEPHQDRIYICPDRVQAGGRVVVGIFCQHLTV